jgi:DnaJ-class molecular chaperone
MMDISEHKFIALEIDAEVAKLKQELRNKGIHTEQQGAASRSNSGQILPVSDKISRLYQVLGVQLGASPKEVKQAYRDFVKKWHPDRFCDNPQRQQKALEVVKKVNEAYAEFEAKNGF